MNKCGFHNIDTAIPPSTWMIHWRGGQRLSYFQNSAALHRLQEPLRPLCRGSGTHLSLWLSFHGFVLGEGQGGNDRGGEDASTPVQAVLFACFFGAHGVLSGDTNTGCGDLFEYFWTNSLILAASSELRSIFFHPLEVQTRPKMRYHYIQSANHYCFMRENRGLLPNSWRKEISFPIPYWNLSENL